jgi:hypothetical protein
MGTNKETRDSACCPDICLRNSNIPYFDSVDICPGNLLRIKKLLPVPLEQAMANYGLPEAEVFLPAASFIRACLRLDPNECATARDLRLHTWLESAFVCC